MPHTTAHLTHPKYRADIDGLRAVAVLSVVGFHAFPGYFRGGFIGVDIFFVISGFLISSIIFSNLEKDSFSIIEFYNRRIRRIFPALITVMVASLVFGWFTLLADEFKQFGKHIAGGTAFISNFILWKESGYFDSAAETKPMLHLWSLAIEEQFYIFWPLLLALVWKRNWSFLRITAAVAVASFVANIYLSYRNPTSAFYLPISRFWELMVGGILAHVALHHPEMNRSHKNAQSFIGIVLLIIGLIFINKPILFPGWWALLPTVGAFLLISAGSTAWVNKKILSHKVLLWFGLISYPLYLWHWPILSYARIMNGQPSQVLRVALVLFSIFLAWVTYQAIEKPLRFGKLKGVSITLVVSLLIVGLCGFSVVLTNGFEEQGFRDKEKTEFTKYFENDIPGWNLYEREKILEKYREKCNFYNIALFRIGESTQAPIEKIANECYVKDSNIQNSLFIWGDSHASQLYFGLNKNLPKNWQILQVTSSGCTPNISSLQDSTTNYCDKSNWFALKTIKEQRPNVVIVAQNKGHNLEGMSAIASFLELQGVKTVIFTGPTPHWDPVLPKVMLRKLWDDTPQKTFAGVDVKLIKANVALKQNFAESPSRHFVSVIDYFCDENGCLTYIGGDRKTGITSWDYGHLTPIASNALARDVLVPLIITPKLYATYSPPH